MDKEQLQFQGRLAVKKQDALKLELKIKGLRESVRLYLDPLEKAEALEMEVVFQQMTELFKTWTLYMETLSEIKAARKILGRE